MKSKSAQYWENIFSSATRILWFTVSELYNGIIKERVDVVRYIYPGMGIAMFFVLRGDAFMAWVTGKDWMRVSMGLREFLVYTGLFGGWLIWAGERAFHRAKVLTRLKNAFLYCGLEANKRLPAFIEDKPIDEHVRRLRVFANGIPLKKFQENRENLEAHLNVTIVKMTEDGGDKSRINIVYAMKDLAAEAILQDVDFQDGEIPIGISYEGPVNVTFRDVAHVLVAGQTGGGKSNFLKVATAVLTKNNPESEVFFLDLKGGMEITDLTNHLGESYLNFFRYEGPKACAKFLSELGGRIETRLMDIAREGASNLDDYLKKKIVASKAAADSGEIGNRESPHRRTYIVIDEIAQLYARDPSIAKDELLAARAAVNRIARQGRAAGVHLIVATQKPDSMSFDQTVKANLPGILCFPMVSQAASISALGTKRAFELNPETKGRAVWKFGSKTIELQTYLFQ